MTQMIATLLASGPTPGPTSSTPFLEQAIFSFGLAGCVGIVVLLLWRRDVIRPGSFERSGVRDLRPAGMGVLLLGACLTYMALAFGMLIGSSTVTDDGTLRYQAVAGLIGGVIAAVAGLAMLWWIRDGARQTGEAAPALGWATVRPGDVVPALACLLLTAPLYMLVVLLARLVGELVRETPLPQVGHETLEQLTTQPLNLWSWLVILSAVIVIPIVEELVYRVYLQGEILRATGSAWVAIGVTSVLFGLVHLPIAEPEAVPSLAFLGLAMGIAYERTQRLGVPILMHMLFNGINVLIAFRVSGT